MNTIEQVRARLGPGDLDALANTVRRPDHPLRVAAASLLAALAGPRPAPARRAPASTPPLPAGARRLTTADASALAARARAENEAAWERWVDETFALSTDRAGIP